MSFISLFKRSIVACALTITACDGVDDEGQRDLVDETDESDDARNAVRQDAPEELEVDAPEGSGFDLVDAQDPAAGPGGTTCCVDCADGWSGWYNLGPADNCNGRAAAFCSQNYWYFINAEWRYACP